MTKYNLNKNWCKEEENDKKVFNHFSAKSWR